MAVCGPSNRPCWQRTENWAQTIHLMDKLGRWTKIIIWRWTSGRVFDHGRYRKTDYDNLLQVDGGERSDGWTVHLIDEFRPWLFFLDGRSWTVDEERPRIHLMDGFFENTKMWAEVDGWTYRWKSVRRGLLRIGICVPEPINEGDNSRNPWVRQSWFLEPI